MSELDESAEVIKSMMKELDQLGRDIDSASAALTAMRKEHEEKRNAMAVARAEFLKKAFGDYGKSSFFLSTQL